MGCSPCQIRPQHTVNLKVLPQHVVSTEYYTVATAEYDGLPEEVTRGGPFGESVSLGGSTTDDSSAIDVLVSTSDEVRLMGSSSTVV
mmetsp:Transcript_10230/g.28913  ORF Transcript_10230/g.28913 Transcript_10230/m.28913 type:complete len:87 (+) Transcript_10230:189-449(+)